MLFLLWMLALSIALTATLVAGQLVDVRSATDCPSAQAIATRLYPLLPEQVEPGAAADTATVEVVGSGGHDTELRIRLVQAGGTEVGDRKVVVQGDCSEAATTAAAVIAAWELQAASLRALPPLTPPTPSAATRPRSWRAWLGAGGGVGLVGGVAAVGRLETILGLHDSRLLGRCGFAVETTRSRSLASGSVAWRHTVFELGLLLRTRHARWPLSLDAGLALGWATLTGRDFQPSRQQRSFEYGGTTAVRLARRLGRWSAWAEVRTYVWAQGQTATVQGDGSTSTDLPRADAVPSVGLSAPLFW